MPLCPQFVEDLVLAALTLHNYLRSGPSKHIYCPKGLADECDPLTGEQIPGLWEKDASSSLVKLTPPSHGNNSTINAKRSEKPLPNAFVVKAVYFGNGERC